MLAALIALTGAGCSSYETPGQPSTPVQPPMEQTQPATKTTTTTTASTSTTPSKTAPKTTTKPKTAAPAPTPIVTPAFTSSGLQLGVVVASYGADLSWTMYSGKDLAGYALVKSTTDANPYYPKQSWFRFESASVGARSYQDRSMEKGKTTYYRVCAVRTDNSIVCGNVAKGTF